MRWLVSIFLLFSLHTQAAEVVDVSRDDRFEVEIAEQGMKHPEQFKFAGIYMANDVQPNKEVVLFVHGANGSPRDFADVAERLDTSRQQAWFAYYPSGNSVAASGRFLSDEVYRLMKANGMNTIRVVAHSMGGLVAWHLVKDLEARMDIEQFVTIATPWNGHWAARLGVWFSPNPSPSWQDLVPDNSTLKAMWSEKLETPYTLVYALTEDSPSSSGDGRISRESQLVPAMEANADRVVLTVGTHVSVLHGDNATLIASLLDNG